MTSFKPMTIEKALGNISPYYHPVLSVITDVYIMPGEHLVFAADSTRHRIVDEKGISLSYALGVDYEPPHKAVVGNQATLLVATNQRWIRAILPFERDYSVRIQPELGELGVVDRWLLREKLKFEWLVPPKEFPHAWLEKQRKTAREYVTENTGALPLSEISVSKREEFTLRNKHTVPESQLHLIRLLLTSNVYYSLKYEDGAFLHQLIQLASLNGGVIPIHDSLQRLRQLKQLLDEGLITNAEFQAKKEELLAEM